MGSESNIAEYLVDGDFDGLITLWWGGGEEYRRGGRRCEPLSLRYYIYVTQLSNSSLIVSRTSNLGLSHRVHDF